MPRHEHIDFSQLSAEHRAKLYAMLLTGEALVEEVRPAVEECTCGGTIVGVPLAGGMRWCYSRAELEAALSGDVATFKRLYDEWTKRYG